jgi:SAM-dependent methyltransferase
MTGGFVCKRCEMTQKEKYEAYLKRHDEKPDYDLWLDKHAGLLEASRDRPFLDLGCGRGNDSLYLTERGFRVIGCDISETAVAAVRKHVPGAQCVVADMLDGLPFDDGSFSAVIADLCLHYFSWDGCSPPGKCSMSGRTAWTGSAGRKCSGKQP